MNRQLDLLNQYNCYEILTEKMSGTKADRPELNRLKDKLRPGEMVVMVVVEKFYRLDRSTKDLIELVADFEEKEIKLLSIKNFLYLFATREIREINDACNSSIQSV